MNNLITWHFWFNLRPAALLPLFLNFLYALSLLLIVGCIIAYFLKAKSGIYNGFWSKAFNFSLTNGLIGAFLAFVNYELVPFFSARFFLLLWVLSMILWLYFIILNLKTIPEKALKLKKEQEYRKYLP